MQLSENEPVGPPQAQLEPCNPCEKGYTRNASGILRKKFRVESGADHVAATNEIGLEHLVHHSRANRCVWIRPSTGKTCHEMENCTEMIVCLVAFVTFSIHQPTK